MTEASSNHGDAGRNADWETLLREGLLTPPDGFSARTMAELVRQGRAEPLPPLTGQRRAPTQTAANWLAWLGAAAAGLAGLTQLAVFGFGIWHATAAG